MVTTVTSYTEVRNRALIADGYDGVVRVVVGNTALLRSVMRLIMTYVHLSTHIIRSIAIMSQSMQAS